ncbi:MULTISPECIES: DUF802 domain-containing protein [Stenotrophomonas]|uniref:DUF802 domain-containing protein n=1 Tax=Stenotrophomonas TaxID=40323 RepID=UPI00201CEF8D|nr:MULTISPECIES: DUF802 domain-containing protein [Stenotrophomonas]MBN5026517.1 DUF802 domain-containing protein [Stenotrophomonas maltophilia]MDH1275539.1 DUF802 domain-containing protein [Stenotrophomonas sp. GD03937]MDH1487172.1 DUF802 domain-containing protein [Stenotrophomonas sp. GD03712]UQY96441.1 DUF802 domain-containing protein [Stenotrophomonas maltophilia]WON66922.1 DUF802 domain-containing protein [Stenotrophomonas maltophilia]
MSRTAFHVVVFLVGLLAVCWIGIGYVSVHPLGAAVAAIIAACYIAGGVELYRYRQSSNGLRSALSDLSAARESLSPWLERVPVGLRNAVRLRVEGERTALPAPVLTPYLVGLLVLLGMLGTLLGMMDTLRGTGLALQSATDMAAIRGSLASPVQGLAVAFGTSIAGVASSAMLGLLAALLRRDRLQAVQQLDRAIAGDLHPYSQAWQRAESLRLLQAQSAALPALVDRLQALTQTFEQHSTAANERLLAGQAEFLTHSQALQERLALSLQQSLREGAEASAAAIGGALQPMAETTLAGLAHHGEALHARVEQAVQAQLAGLADGFERSRVATEASWAKVLGEQTQAQQTLVSDLRQHLQGFSEGQRTQADALVARLGERLQADASGNAEAWRSAAEQQQALNSALVERQQQALLAASEQLDERAQALLQALDERHAASQSLLQDHEQQRSQDWQAAQAAAATAHAELQASLDRREQQRQARWDAVSAELQQAHATLHSQLQAGDEQRLQHWSDALQAISRDLATQQQQVCDTLAATAQQIGDNGRAQANATLAEVSTLLQTAADAPKAAADVINELRSTLSESLVRDNAMLEERGRLLATVQTLLDAINHASHEQRTAVDALVGGSAELLERVGNRFTDHIAAETGKLDAIAAALSGSAGDVGQLAGAFGEAVAQFGSASTELSSRLELIGGALDASLARSDEQLAYYVAQAREVVDLSLLSQKQVMEELQQLATRRGKAGSA